MSLRGFFLLAASMTFLRLVPIAAADPSELTANELAQVLGIQWWIFSAPEDTRSGDAIYVHWETRDGKGSGAEIEVKKPGEQAKIFYWVDNATHTPMVSIVNSSGASVGALNFPDGFVSAASCGIANGSMVKTGDFLVKLEKRIPGLLDYSTDNSTTLKPNEIGLKVEIRRKAMAASQ
jgi:hypothetical protein